MRKGWEYKKLNEVCEKGASNIVINKLTDNSGEYPLFGASGLVKNIDFFHQDKPYIGIVKDGAGVGRVNIYPAYSSLVGTMQYIFPKEGYSIDFIKYFLVKLDLSHCVSGATIPHIYFKDYGKENIPTPSLDTQLAIVSELDKINELIRLKKEQLKDFDNLAQSLFYEMFGDPVENEKGWEVKKLNEIVSDNCSISYGIVQPGDGVENGVPVVRPVDMTKTFVSRKGLKKTTKEISDSYKRTILKGNEILMCVRGTTGLISMATPELQGCNVTRGIAPIECGPTCDKWFIFYQFLNPAIQHHIAEYTRGITLKQINMKDVRNIPLCLPPLSLQQLFAQRIEQIEREKSEVQKSIQDLETLLASRMQYWLE